MPLIPTEVNPVCAAKHRATEEAGAGGLGGKGVAVGNGLGFPQIFLELVGDKGEPPNLLRDAGI